MKNQTWKKIILSVFETSWKKIKEDINDVSVRLPVSGAQCFIGTENYSDSSVNLIYAEDKLSQGYEETVSCIRHLVEDNNECRDKTEKDIRFEIDWKLYVFDVRYQTDFLHQI